MRKLANGLCHVHHFRLFDLPPFGVNISSKLNKTVNQHCCTGNCNSAG